MFEDDSKPYDDINVTPMLDLAYTLLIIFILMTTAVVQGTKVDLPRASQAQSLATPTTKSISVNSEGRIFLDAVPVTIEELEQRLVASKVGGDPPPVIVRGDNHTHYQSIMEVLDVIGRVGLSEVGLVTQPKR